MKKYVCDILALIAILIALTALVGWGFNVPVLYRIQDGWVNMNPLTCIGVLVASLHCISRAFVRREDNRRRMLTYLGISYGFAFLLMIWQLSFLIVEIQRCIADRKIDLGPGAHEYLPSIVTTASLLAYSITGFCTRNSWSVAALLISVGSFSLLSYAANASYHYTSASTGMCLLLLGMAIYVARRTGPTHWFITECKNIF